MNEWNDITVAAKSVAVNISASGDNTVYTVTPGKRWVALHVWLQAEAYVEVTIKSGASTSVSGQIEFAIDAEKEWKNGGVPVFKANAVGDTLVINLGTAVQVNGFIIIGEST